MANSDMYLVNDGSDVTPSPVLIIPTNVNGREGEFSGDATV